MKISTFPLSVKAALGYHVVAVVYGLSRIPTVFQTGAFGIGQILGLLLFCTAIVLIFVRPQAGRWLTIGLFAFGLIFCFIDLAVLILKGESILSAWPLLLLSSFFICCGGALLLNKSAKTWANAVGT